MDNASMETMLTKAQGELAQAEEQLKELQSRVNALRQLVCSLSALTGKTDMVVAVQEMKRTIKEEIVEILKDSKGQPLTGLKVAQYLTARGFKDVNPRTVQTMLWSLEKKDARVTKVQGEGFAYRVQ